MKFSNMKQQDTTVTKFFPTSITGLADSWQLPAQIEPQKARELSEQLGISVDMSSLILRRTGGLLGPAKALWLGEPAFPDVCRLPGMEEAAVRIGRAVQEKGHVLIYSDFDADGVTSAVILKEALAIAGVSEVSVFFPCRFKDGYGFHPEHIQGFAENGVDLIITADCGITGEKACEEASRLGIDVIVTDHHKVGERIPNAIAIINPQVPSWEDFRLWDLSGAGVAYLLALGLFESLGLSGQIEPFWAHDMLTLSIAGDGQPVNGINRFWVKKGLKSLADTNRPGIMALFLVSGIFAPGPGFQNEYASAITSAKEASTDQAPDEFYSIDEIKKGLHTKPLEFERHVMFGLVPRINASGRMGDAKDAYDLLCETDMFGAIRLASKLDKLNTERRNTEQNMLKQCFSDIEGLYPKALVSGNDFDFESYAEYPRYSVFAHRSSWHPGIIGIAASRVRDRYWRPCALAGGEGDFLKGSVRGIPGLNIHAVLSKCSDLLSAFGGHEGAGGFSIDKANVGRFAEAFENACTDLLHGSFLEQSIELDHVSESDGLEEDFLRSCLQLEPFGKGNPAPMIGAFGCRVKGARLLGKTKSHLELTVQGKQPSRFIWFGADSEKAAQICFSGACDIVFTPNRNVYKGVERVSLVVKDVRPAWGLFGTGYEPMVQAVLGRGPGVVYTWSKDAANSMYVAFLRQGCNAKLHFKGQRESLIHDAKTMLESGDGIVISTSPWDLFDGRGEAKAEIFVAHNPINKDSFERLRRLGKTPSVDVVYLNGYETDSKIWLESLFPSKESMENVWKSLAGRARKALPLWEAGPIHFGSLPDFDDRKYEQKLLLIGSCISIMMELGMIVYDETGRMPQLVLSRPNGQVSLLESALYTKGLSIKEGAKVAGVI